MRYVVIFLINLLFCVILINRKDSALFNIGQMTNLEVIDHYQKNIVADTRTYTNMPKDDMFRTVGYPLILKLFLKSDNFILLLLLFNCLIGTWFFYVLYQMIGRKAWIFFALGGIISYIPLILTDLLFATIFVTAIWQIKKRLWLHFLLIGIASLIRPSLAFFFLIEPFVLYFYGYRGSYPVLGFIIIFLVTSFSPIRNYVNHGIFTHSTVLHLNMTHDKYIAGANSKIGYMIKAFIANNLGSHWSFIGLVFSKYPNPPWLKLNYIGAFFNGIIWGRFLWNVYQRRVNYGNVLILIYFIGPALLAANGARMRLPIEWILFL